MSYNSYQSRKKCSMPSPFWIMLILISFSCILVAACNNNASPSNNANPSNNQVASGNKICPVSFMSCNSVDLTINLQLGHPYSTQAGTTICNGNLEVNGSEVNKNHDPKLGTIVVYRGSGGELEAPFNPVDCVHFPPDANQRVIDNIVNGLSHVMETTGCGNSQGCTHGVKQYSFGK